MKNRSKKSKDRQEKSSFLIPFEQDHGEEKKSYATSRSRVCSSKLLRVALLFLVLGCGAFAYYESVQQIDEYNVSYSPPPLHERNVRQESRARLEDAKLKNERTAIELERIRLEKMKAELSLEKEKAKRAQIEAERIRRESEALRQEQEEMKKKKKTKTYSPPPPPPRNLVKDEIEKRFSAEDVTKMKNMMGHQPSSSSRSSSSSSLSPWGFDSPQPSLWLRADRGVKTSESSDRVLEWKDQSFSSHLCVSKAQSSSSSTQHSNERGGEFHLRHSSRHRNPHQQQKSMEDKSPHLVFSSTGIPDSIAFPCTMHCPTMRLNDRSTVFFTLLPQALEAGPHAEGQRFFGTYPEGQFRFVDGDAGFYSHEKGVHESKSSSVRPGRWNIATYRFDRFAEISINSEGAPIRIKDNSDRYVRAVFTNDRQGNPGVYVGGVRGDTCGFKGSIGEVLYFDALLSNEQINLVKRYLGARWKVNVRMSQEDSVVDGDVDDHRQEDRHTGTSSSSVRAHRHPSRDDRNVDRNENQNINKVLDWEPPIGSNSGLVIAWRSARDAARVRLDRGDMSDSEIQRELDVLKQIKNSFSSQGEEEKSLSLDTKSSSSSSSSSTSSSSSRKTKKKRQKLNGNIINMPAPEDASMEKKFQWEDKVTKLKKEIRDMKIGGPKLREWLQKKKRELTLYRSKLFGDV